MKRLIINADDFGLTPGVNRAIIELNQAHALTSATLMATTRSFVPAVHLAFAQTTLGIGCHVVLVDGSPLLPPGQIPSLLEPAAAPPNPRRLPSTANPAPAFRPTLGSFVRDLVRGRIHEREMEQEAIAQIRRIQSSGLTVTHLDTHKHTHIFPRVLRPLLRAALACGIPAIRNPFEPHWSLRATGSAGAARHLQLRLLYALRPAFLRLTRQAGLLTTDGALGVLATGTLDGAALRRLLHAMPAGTWELVCHPGYADADLHQSRTRLLASREVERSALTEVIPEAAQRDTSLSLIHFRALPVREQVPLFS